MNRRGIFLSILGIVLVSTFIIILVNENSQKYIMYDKTLLALTIDGNSSLTFPTDINTGKYHADINCSGGVGEYQPIRILDTEGIETDEYEMKFTVKNIEANGLKCSIDFITINDNNINEYKLVTEVEEKAKDFGVAKDIAFTPTYILEQSAYNIVEMNTTSTGADAFFWDETNKTWENQAYPEYQGQLIMSFKVPSGGYDLCYTTNADYYGVAPSIYVDNNSFSVDFSSGEHCVFLGDLTSSNIIQIVYDEYSSPPGENFIFYLKGGEITYHDYNVGYRYTGKQPNNWVWFNNEKWRIIGSIPTTLSDGTTVDNRVKIIREESLGGLSYNTTYSSNWSSSLFNNLLNNNYYGRGDVTGSSYCLSYSASSYGLCNYTNIGISNSETDYYGRMVEGVFMNIGAAEDGLTTEETYIKELNSLTTSAINVGLMNASDFGFSTGESNVSNSSLSNYRQNNWLYGKGTEWTMTPCNTSTINYSFNGNMTCTSILYEPYMTRPVVYLDPEVYIISGNGTESTPYILGM